MWFKKLKRKKCLGLNSKGTIRKCADRDRRLTTDTEWISKEIAIRWLIDHDLGH
jgi:hypothetical protein